MPLFGNPAPQWQETKSAAAKVSRMVPVLDAASGFWTFRSGALASGTLSKDATTGFLVFDQTTTVQSIKVTRTPAGFLIFY